MRWSLARSGRLSSPRWSPEIDGSTRIAYLRGDTLRLVAGDGTEDRVLDPSVAPTPPAWKPGDSFVVAYLTGAGRIRVVDTETGKLLWSSLRLPAVTKLAWSGDGTRLLVLTGRSLIVFGERGQRKGRAFLGAEAVAAAFEPRSHRIAVLLRYPQQSAVQLRSGDAPGVHPRTVFRADGLFGTLAWSPDARWLLAGWKSADALLFVTPAGRQRVVADIARQLGAFPDVPQAGWCCATG